MAGGHAAKRAAQLIHTRARRQGLQKSSYSAKSQFRLLANTALGYCGLPRDPL